VTFRQQLLSSSNSCLLSSARGRHREQQIVGDVAQLVGPLVSVHDTLTLLSDLDCLANPPCSLVRLLASFQLMTWFDFFLVGVIRDYRYVFYWLWSFVSWNLWYIYTLLWRIYHSESYRPVGGRKLCISVQFCVHICKGAPTSRGQLSTQLFLMTASFSQQLLVLSRPGRTEYQLLLMKSLAIVVKFELHET